MGGAVLYWRRQAINTPETKRQAVAGLPQGPCHIEICSLKTYCATNPLDVAGTVGPWPRGVSDPSALTRNPISAPAPETL